MSYHKIFFPQEGQYEGGFIIDFPFGKRKIHTFAKLPKIRPKRKIINPIHLFYDEISQKSTFLPIFKVDLG